MTINSNYLNQLLLIFSLWLGFVALVIIGVKTIRLFRGKETNPGNWTDCLAGSSLSLSILFLLLLSVCICQNEALNTGQAIKKLLSTFLMILLSHPGWIAILLMILLSFTLRRKKQPEAVSEHKAEDSSDQNIKLKAIWFMCTLIIGSMSAAWLHLIYSKNGLSLFLLVLLLWCIAAMLVIFIWVFRRKNKTIYESTAD